MSGNPTEEEKAQARAELKDLTQTWREAVDKVEQGRVVFEDAAKEYWNFARKLIRVAQTAGINRAEVQPTEMVQDVDWFRRGERGRFRRSEEERIKRVLRQLENLEKKD